jgi:hypothetical protein
LRGASIAGQTLLPATGLALPSKSPTGQRAYIGTTAARSALSRAKPADSGRKSMCEEVENVEREAHLDWIVAYLYARHQHLAQRGGLNAAEESELRDLMLHGFDKPVRPKEAA